MACSIFFSSRSVLVGCGCVGEMGFGVVMDSSVTGGLSGGISGLVGPVGLVGLVGLVGPVGLVGLGVMTSGDSAVGVSFVAEILGGGLAVPEKQKYLVFTQVLSNMPHDKVYMC